MEVYQIKVFLEVARHLSFTEAADALNLTQPAVSAKIKSLETELGALLFHRLGKKIQLTELGYFLLEESPKLIQVENQLLNKIEEIKKGKFSHLKIGCTSSLADGWLPDIMFEFRQRNPEIQIQCAVFDSAEFLYQAITCNQVDIGVSDISFEDYSEISANAVADIYYSLIVSSTHKFANQNWLSLKELKNEPWVMLPLGSPNRLVFENRLLELGLDLSDFSQFEVVDTSSLMRTYLIKGNYLGFASSFEFKSECKSGTLVTIPLQEFALAGNVFLLSPKRLSQSASINSNLPDRSRRPSSLTPTQKFTALAHLATQSVNPRISSLFEGDNKTAHAGTSNVTKVPQLETAPTKQPVPVRLRSPSFVIRSTNSQRPDTITLAIGIQNSTITTVTAGLAIQRLGLLEHFLPRDGRYSSSQYQIHWCNFPSGAPIVERLHSGQLDIGILGDYPLLLSVMQQDDSSNKLMQTRLVSFVSINPDGSCNAVIVPHKSKLNCVEDLRGRVIAVPFGSSAHGMVMRSLNHANLFAEVRLTSLEDSNLNQPFEHPIKLADGYAHFAPFHDIACRQGRFRYLLGDDLSGLPAFYGVVVSEALAERYPEIVIAYLNALRAAQHWYATTPSALSLISQWTNLDTELISQILTYHNNYPGRFFPEMTIRPDWITQHISQLSLVPGNEYLNSIDLNKWIQPEFLHKMQNQRYC